MLTREQTLVLAAAVALVVVLVAVSTATSLQHSAGKAEPMATPSRWRSSPTPTPSPTPAPTPTPDDSWIQAWRTDLDPNARNPPWIYTDGDTLVVYERKGRSEPDRMRGYSLAGGRPTETWSISPGEALRGLTSSAVVTTHSLIDPKTSEAAPAPWNGTPELVTDNFIITCENHQWPRCSGWDLDDGAASLRWGPVDLPAAYNLTLNPSAMTGDTSTGHVLATFTVPDTNQEQAVFISLADGSVGNVRPTNRDAGIIPAADGWIDLFPDRERATALAPDGTETDSYAVSRSTSSLLLTDSGAPSREQYKRAFTTADTSWASIALTCGLNGQQSTGRGCRLNGVGPVADADRETKTLPAYESGFTPTMGQRYLILSYASDTRPKYVRIIDLQEHRVIPREDPLYGQEAYVTVVSADLLIAVDGSDLVAYTPSG